MFFIVPVIFSKQCIKQRSLNCKLPLHTVFTHYKAFSYIFDTFRHMAKVGFPPSRYYDPKAMVHSVFILDKHLMTLPSRPSQNTYTACSTNYKLPPKT